MTWDSLPAPTVRLLKGLVRIPDVAYFSWDKLPGRVLPTKPIPDLTPDLAVEVLSEGNTALEMERKLREYFLAGVRLVWLIDPHKRQAKVFTSPDGPGTTLDQTQAVGGGEMLPGFSLPLADLFARLPAAPKKSRTTRKKRAGE